MTLEEFEQKKKHLYRNYRHRLLLLGREYAWSISKFKIGDIIKGHQGVLKIDSIHLRDDNNIGYSGMKLKADLTQPKKQERIYADKNAILIKSRP